MRALDRIVRDDEGGAEAALRIIRLFRQPGVVVVSVQEPWLNGAGEVQDLPVAFAGWVAGQESARKSERIKNGLARRRAEGKPVSLQPDAADRAQCKRSGYIAAWRLAARGAPPTTPGRTHDPSCPGNAGGVRLVRQRGAAHPHDRRDPGPGPCPPLCRQRGRTQALRRGPGPETIGVITYVSHVRHQGLAPIRFGGAGNK